MARRFTEPPYGDDEDAELEEWLDEDDLPGAGTRAARERAELEMLGLLDAGGGDPHADPFTVEPTLHGVPTLDDFSPADQRQIADLARRGTPSGDAPASPKELAACLGDPDWVRRRLLEAPADVLWPAEALVEAGGLLTETVLVGLVRERTGWSEPEAFAATMRLQATGLAVATAAGRNQPRELALFAPAAAVVGRLVAGASLPEIVAPDAAPEIRAGGSSGGHRELRDAIALAALAMHRRLRATRSGRVDRTTLKTFAKGLGDAAAIGAVLEQAIESGLLALVGDRLVPDLATLEAAALGRVELEIDPREPAGLLRSWLSTRPGTWVTLEAAARACWRASLRPPQAYASFGYRQPTETPRTIAPAIAATPWLEHGHTEQGTPVVRVATPAAGGTGDGHVTPGLEVFLGPRADPSIVAAVALAAELIKLDHVLTLKLSSKSVSAAVSAGLEPERIRAALAGVGPHGLPPNVERLVDDWVSGMRPARVARGVFLFGEPDRVATARQALGTWVRSMPAAGALELDPGVPDDVLEAACARAKLAVPPVAARALSSARWDAERFGSAAGSRRLRGSVAPRLPLRPVPDPELRARQLGATAPRPAEPAPTPPLTAPEEVDAWISSYSARGRELLAGGGSADEVRFFATCANAAREAREAIARWLVKLPEDARAEAIGEVRQSVHALLPVLVLAPASRNAVLARGGTLASVQDAARMIAASTPSAVSGRGRELLRLTSRLGARGRAPDGAATRAGPPAPDEETITAAEVQLRIEAAIEQEAGLCVHFAGGATAALFPDRILRRGGTPCVVGLDAEENAGRVYTLESIRYVHALEPD